MRVKTMMGKRRHSLWHRTVIQLSVILVLALASLAQSPEQGQSRENSSTTSTSAAHPPPSTPQAPTEKQGSPSEGQQTGRILGVIPNYRAVSADTHLPPLSFRGKFKLATQDSFDYSSFLVAGFTAGISFARNQTPEFHQGAAGYARYFWHSFADQAVGNYFTEFIVPYVARQDPRYYTLGHGGVFKRSYYSISRLFVTRTDSGGTAFNFSEIIGNGAGAGVSNLYYPSPERTWTKTGQKWADQVALDGIFNVMKEFWPDVRQRLFHK